MIKPKYEKIGDSRYKVTANGRYLCEVTKVESATRSYWYIDSSYNKNALIKVEGSARDHGPYERFDKTRGGLVFATFPLELGITDFVDESKYQF